MGKQWRQVRRAWQDERGRYWEEADPWEEVTPVTIADKFGDYVVKFILIGAVIYLLAVVLAMTWTGGAS